MITTCSRLLKQCDLLLQLSNVLLELTILLRPTLRFMILLVQLLVLFLS